MDSLEHTIFIAGIPKRLSSCKLKYLIGKHISMDQWRFHQIIPLEECNMIQVACANSEICEKFLQINFASIILNGNRATYAFRTDALNILPFEAANSTSPTLDSLISDCLLKIFKKCSLKDQIALAKVCQYFHDLIVNIWSCRYKTLYYDLYDFEFKSHLNTNEIQDFCTIVGKFVRELTFTSIFYFPLIHKHLMQSDGNLMENAKKFMNMNLCKNLMYFENLEIFKVQGKFLADFTVKELARYCKRLKVLELLDTDTRWLRGKHVHQLSKLEVLHIKDCENFQRRNLSRICHAINLKCLNIVECKSLQNPKYIEKLCRNLNYLQVLQLTAIAANVGMISAILNLQNLKILQFYWLNDFNEFEDMLFAQIVEQHKAEVLISLRFINDRVFINNESHECLGAYKYALMRESVTINGRTWQWNEEKFNKFITILGKCINLQEISCEYCRLFTHANLLQLANACNSLKNIKFMGCRSENDAGLLEMWQRQMDTHQCHLNIEGLISVADLMKLRQQILELPYRSENYKNPILRSIECRFK